MRSDYKRSWMVASIVLLMKAIYKVSGKTLLSKQHKKNKPYVPKDFTESIMEDITVYQHLESESNTHLIYLHGGAYVHYGQSLHFAFLRKISKQHHISVH